MASGALAPPPLPQGSAPEPAVSARGLGGRGGGAERRGLTGVCAPNGTSDTPGCAKTDLPPSPWQQRGGPSAFFFYRLLDKSERKKRSVGLHQMVQLLRGKEPLNLDWRPLYL